MSTEFPSNWTVLEHAQLELTEEEADLLFSIPSQPIPDGLLEASPFEFTCLYENEELVFDEELIRHFGGFLPKENIPSFLKRNFGTEDNMSEEQETNRAYYFKYYKEGPPSRKRRREKSAFS